MTIRTTFFQLLTCSALFLSTAQAQAWRGHDDGNWNGGRPPWWDDNDNGNDGNDSNGSSRNPFGFGAQYDSSRRALVAHAVIACLVWAFLIPVGGILLRVNIKSPWMLRVHAILQITSFLLYVVAVGLGIYLIRQVSFGPYYSLWSDAHPRLGLVILALAVFQPILGAIHHRMFKKRVTATKAGDGGPAPGRTVPGYMHLWLGRSLIVLGIVNGGLGIRLAARTPGQSASTTRKAAIGYGVAAGVVFLVYLVTVISFEFSKSKRDRKYDNSRNAPVAMHDVPPSYVESQESLQKDHRGVTRYT